MRTASILSFLAVLSVAGCGTTNTVESAGAALSDKHCSCERIKRDFETRVGEEVLKQCEASNITDQTEAWKIYSSIQEGLKAEAAAVKEEHEACEKDLKALAEEVKLKYPRDEDRKTIKNMVSDRKELCKKNYKEEHPSWSKVLQERRQKANDQQASEANVSDGPGDQMNAVESTSEKQNIVKLLEDMLAQYDTLNTSDRILSAQITLQKKKVDDLVKKVNRGNIGVADAKKEAEALRRIMQGHLVTIDSLNMSR